MALKLMEEVWNSSLKPSERLVLLRIADRINWAAYDRYVAGRGERPSAHPGIRSLARDCGLTVQGVLNILNRLRLRGVLLITKGQGTRPNHYQILEEALARAQPDGTRRRPPRVPRDRTRSAGRPEAQCSTGTSIVFYSDDPGVPQGGTEPQNPKEPYKSTGAVAPECFSSSQEDRPPRHVEFRHYAAIASAALQRALKEDRDDSLPNAIEHFKILCAKGEPPFPYDSEIARKAVEAAIWSREKAKQHFLRTHRELAGRG